MANNQVVSGGTVTAAKANDITYGTTAPTGPTTGQAWVDTALAIPVLKVYNGSAWIEAGGAQPDFAYFMAQVFI